MTRTPDLDQWRALASKELKGADPDTLVASARAYIAALNKLMLKRLRSRPEEIEPGVRSVTP